MNHVYEATGDVILMRSDDRPDEHYYGAALKLEQTLPGLWQLSSLAFPQELTGFDKVRVQVFPDRALHGPITSTGVGAVVFRSLVEGAEPVPAERP